MAILADTNVLLRSLYPDHPHYYAAEKALTALRLRGEDLCIAPQNLIELAPGSMETGACLYQDAGL